MITDQILSVLICSTFSCTHKNNSNLEILWYLNYAWNLKLQGIDNLNY